MVSGVGPRDRPYLSVCRPHDSSGAELNIFSSANDGRTLSIPRAGDKNTIRFAVGVPARRSSIWRLWAPANKNDVYLATRRSAGIFKVSLHESGDYRVQWVARDRQGATFTGRDLDESRIMYQWVRSPPTNDGWTEELALIVPTSEIVSVPGDAGKLNDVCWLSPAPAGGHVEMRVVRVQPERAVYDMMNVAREGNFTFVGGFELVGGDAVLLLAVVSEEPAAGIDRLRASLLRDMPADFDLTPTLAPRAMAIDHPDDGICTLWDLAANPVDSQ